MKIGERFHDDEGSKFVVQEIHDFNPTLREVEALREINPTGEFGESKHVGRIPGKLFYEWLKEAGVSPSDTGAVQEVLKKKMMSGDASHFRIWEGNY